LGKRIENISLIDDQRYILNQIFDIVKDNDIQAVLISGDVYDKSIPSVEATQLLDDTLERFSNLEIPTYIIGGNHDGIERLSFANSMLKKSNIYIANAYHGTLQKETLHDEYGELDIYMMPYITPLNVRSNHNAEVSTLEDAFKVVFENNPIDTTRRSILMAHQYVLKSKDNTHEFDDYLGGTENTGVSVFENRFDYIALGHIHKPYWVLKDKIRYCGSPLKYSLNECNNVNSVTIVDFKEKGNLSFEEVELQPLRNLRRLKGSLENILENAVDTNDYVEVTLTDEEYIINAMDKIRNVYPNVVKLSFDNTRTRSVEYVNGSATDVEDKSMLELFENFFEDVYSQNLQGNPNYMSIISETVKEVERSNNT
jgi:exonuclease SbcD